MKHFCDKYFKYQLAICDSVPIGVFNKWFAQLDKDGDGQVGIIELANDIQVLTKMIQDNKNVRSDSNNVKWQ